MNEKTAYLVTFNNEYWCGNKAYIMTLTEGEKDLIEWLDNEGYFDRTEIFISPVVEASIEF